MIEIPVSIGEIFDKISILQIKQKYITDSKKLENINRELYFLNKKVETISISNNLLNDLYIVNEKLWKIEDNIRLYEKRQDFGIDFIQLARSIYKLNDKRADIKKQINLITNSELIEEKSYA